MKIYVLGKELSVSEGNSKMGKVMNFSLMPGWTCSCSACNTCYKQGCYAKSIVDRRPTVKAAWNKNTSGLMYIEGCGMYCHFIGAMSNLITKRKPKVFRIHVGGDFFSREYFKAWVTIASIHPEVNFFAFTKQWDYIKGIRLPINFALIASAWPSVGIPKWARERLPIAWLVQHGQPVPTRYGRPTCICKGDCTKCNWCFSLTKSKGDVAFLKHR